LLLSLKLKLRAQPKQRSKNERTVQIYIR